MNLALQEGMYLVLFRPLGRMRTPPPAEQPEESAYDREVETTERYFK